MDVAGHDFDSTFEELNPKWERDFHVTKANHIWDHTERVQDVDLDTTLLVSVR